MANGPSAKEIAAGDPKKRLETAVLVRLCPTSGDGLATAVARKNLWPTPRAADHKNGRGKTGNRSKEAAHRAGWTLSEKVRLWPTPTAGDCKSSNGRQDNGRTPQLQEQVWARGREDLRATKLYPTPNACQGNNTSAMNSGAQGRKMLRAKVGDEEARLIVGGQLNPDWVELLMGFPLGWTATSGSEASPVSPTASPTARTD